MPIAILMILLLLPAQSWAGGLWGSEGQDVARVQVTEAYLSWRTGPASGYPVFHTSEKGEWLTILQRKTSWIKVMDSRGREGWVSVADLAQTVDVTGETVSLQVPDLDSFGKRRAEAGLMMGEFDGAAVMAGYGGLWLTRNLSAELWGAQILGSASEIRMVNGNLVHQPFPDWRISPFFTLGIGHIWVEPKASLAQPEERDNSIGHAGLGIRAYITDRYFIRAEVKDYKVFTTRSTNEVATEWKIGLSIFF